MEAVINSCPAFAISQEYYEQPDFALAAVAATIVARNILEHGLSRGELLNVNVPAVPIEECEGIEVTRVGRRIYQDQLVERVDPRGIPYYWIGGPPPSGHRVPGTDFHAVVNRRIAVTPIHLDLTGRRLLRRLQDWDWSLEPSWRPARRRPRPAADGRRDAAEEARIAEESRSSGARSAPAGARHRRMSMAADHPRRLGAGGLDAMLPAWTSPPPPSRHPDARSGAVRARAARPARRRARPDPGARRADARGRAGRLAVDGPARRPPAPRPDLVLVGRRGRGRVQQARRCQGPQPARRTRASCSPWAAPTTTSPSA